ncbi:unnamed protein product [Lactuca saligna]|uniref:Uncharacterized protein n=1 Tax=Lactuca saligna TaxID=75948 RepID=A0AA36E2F4_LACSI|nr:unnamed protein product [Lactuca saligna]
MIVIPLPSPANTLTPPISSNANPPFWIPIPIMIPERPTESPVFNVMADSPRVQFNLLNAHLHGRITIWTQPSHVTPGFRNEFQATPKTRTTNGIPPSLASPSWDGFASLASYLFSWQEYFDSESKQGKKLTEQDYSDMQQQLHGFGVTTVALDPTCGGSVIAIVIVEGQYMSPYDPDEGPSITGWRVQRWESSLEPVVLHPIFGNPTSTFGGQPTM